MFQDECSTIEHLKRCRNKPPLRLTRLEPVGGVDRLSIRNAEDPRGLRRTDCDIAVVNDEGDDWFRGRWLNGYVDQFPACRAGRRILVDRA